MWTSTSTEARLKKRIVRTVIHEVIADVDSEAAEIVLVVHWIGGVHSEIRLPRRRRGQRNSASADVIAAVRQLVLIANDDLIAGILNRNGLVTGYGNRWTRERVTSLRSPACDPVAEPRRRRSHVAPERSGWQRKPGLAGWAVDLQPCSSFVITGTRYYRARAAESKIPHGIASRSAKPLLFNQTIRGSGTRRGTCR